MKTIDVYAPFDGELLAQITPATNADIDQALALAKDAHEHYEARLPAYKRVAILEKTVELMSQRIEALTLIALKEGGKPYMDTKVEVERAINGVKLAIEHIGAFTGKGIAMGHTQSSANRMAYTMKEPIGVVVAISAFNHPLNLAVHQLVPAIAVGSPVIIKPSENTPMSALNFIEILYEAGLPKEYAQVIVCDIPQAEYLSTHEKVDYLSFIGSANVGWYLNSKVSRGTRVGLEHGGVAPVIVEADANISELIPALTKGGFYHAGQVCVSVQRIYVHEDIFDDVAQKLKTQAQALIIGDPKDPKTQVGPLINSREITRIDQWVNEAIEEGATLLCGGKTLGESCYEATILLNPNTQSKVSTQEIFAPVVCLYAYKDLDQAIDQANSLDVSFQASVFTQDIDKALYAVKRLNGTAVMVNDHTAFRVDWMPFGGAKASGLGLGGIAYSMEEMSQEKLMVIKSKAL